MSCVHRITLLLVAIQFLVGCCSSYVLLDMWQNGCKSGWYRNDRISGTGCYSWPSAGGTRGIQMTFGSCLAVYTNTGCTLLNGHLTQLNQCIRANIYGARECTRTDTSVQCSSGKYLKAIEVSGNGLAGGLAIQCYTPEATTSSPPNETYFLGNSSISDPIRISCAEGIGGLVNQIDDVRDVVHTTTPVCHTGQCPDGEAVVGITASIEDHTEFIKQISVICAPLEKPVDASSLVNPQ